VTITGIVGVREGPQRSVRDALLENLRYREVLLAISSGHHTRAIFLDEPLQEALDTA
jgi:hypothetical protein